MLLSQEARLPYIGEDQGETTIVVLVKSKTSSGNGGSDSTGGSGSTGGSTGSLAQYAGTYKFYSMTSGGYTIGADLMNEDFVVLVLNADGTGTWSVSSGGESGVTLITWTTRGFDYNGQHFGFTIEGDTVTFTMSSATTEVTYVLKKK